MLAAAGDDDLRRLVGEAVLAQKFGGDGLAQFRDAAAGRVFGEPGGERLGGGVLDVLRRVKSGSPAPKPTTSSPAAFMALALASMASVSDGDSDAAR
jgi:hypothetical protein